MTSSGENPLRLRWLLVPAGVIVFLVTRLFVLRSETAILGSPFGCPLHKYTGCYCAGCGGTRAMFALLKGDPGGSWRMNPVVLIGLSLALVYGACQLLRKSRFGRTTLLSRLSFPASARWCLLGLAMLFMILRNIPVAPFTALAPH